jgi:hypothetical protein
MRVELFGSWTAAQCSSHHLHCLWREGLMHRAPKGLMFSHAVDLPILKTTSTMSKTIWFFKISS